MLLNWFMHFMPCLIYIYFKILWGGWVLDCIMAYPYAHYIAYNCCECFEVLRWTRDVQVSSGKFMVLFEMIELWHDYIYVLGNSDTVLHVAIIDNTDTVIQVAIIGNSGTVVQVAIIGNSDIVLHGCLWVVHVALGNSDSCVSINWFMSRICCITQLRLACVNIDWWTPDFIMLPLICSDLEYFLIYCWFAFDFILIRSMIF